MEKVGVDNVIRLCGKSLKKKEEVRSPGALVCCRHFVPVVNSDRSEGYNVSFQVRQGLDGDTWQNEDETTWLIAPPLLRSPLTNNASPSSSTPDSYDSDYTGYPKSPYKTPTTSKNASKSRKTDGDELWTFLEAKYGDVDSIASALHKVSLEHNVSSPSPMDSPEQWKLIKQLYTTFRTSAHARKFLAPLVAAIDDLGLRITDKKLATYIGSDIRTVKDVRKEQKEVC